MNGGFGGFGMPPNVLQSYAPFQPTQHQFRSPGVSSAGAPGQQAAQPQMSPQMMMMLGQLMRQAFGQQGYTGMPGVEALYGSPGGAMPSATQAGGPR